jgi:peptide subunit release factor 1 (eRF1)
MLDELLGRAELKSRIEELEDELHHCERELAAERDRRSAATSEKQTAEERANRLEDRIADLEGTVERLRETAEGERSFARTERLQGARRSAVLDRLESVRTGAEGAFTAYVPDGHALSKDVYDAFGDRAALVGRAAPCLAVTDDAGLASACLSVPDPPAPFETWDESFRVDRDRVEPRGRFALALVRSDLFALGVYQGDQRVAFQGFDSELQSQHSRGGFSQARFERLRDAQIDDHVDRCRAALADVGADRLYVVGERTVLDAFDDADVTATVDATGDPEDALADAFHEFWTVRLRVL